MWVISGLFYSAPLSDEDILSQIPSCLASCSLMVNFKSRVLSSLISFFFFKIILALLVPSPFHVNFRMRTRDSLEDTFYPEEYFLLGVHTPATETVEFHTWDWPWGRSQTEKWKKNADPPDTLQLAGPLFLFRCDGI